MPSSDPVTASMSNNSRKRKNTSNGTPQATLHNFFGTNPPKRRASNPKEDNRDNPIIILDSDEEVELVCDGPKILENPRSRAADRCYNTIKSSPRSSPGKENLVPFTKTTEEATSCSEHDASKNSFGANVPLSFDLRGERAGEPSSVTLESCVLALDL